jgi:hypothetical protein
MNHDIQKLWLVMVSLLVPVTSQADDQALQNNIFYRSIASQYTITQVVQADINNDNHPETLIGYREAGSASNQQQGGLLILGKSGSQYRVLWHALFERLYPKSISASGDALTIDFVQAGPKEERVFPRTLIRGRDFFLRTDEANPFSKAAVSASSTLRKDTAPANIFDGRVDTAWAEGAEGTGTDEDLKIEFRKPVDLGLIGVLQGNYKSRRDWTDNNRLNRAGVTVETSSDRFDVESAVDFGKDLGFGLYGDRVDLNFTNKPMMHYFKIDKRSVVSVDLKITSVLLGDKHDDTFISEIDFAELIPAQRLIGGTDANGLENTTRAISDQKADVKAVMDKKSEHPVYDENF